VKFTSFALLALLAICSTAFAQLAPQRTWPELKEAVQERANRNAYPMTGMKSEDVREILSQINSLDRDEWAAA
jgi:esterase FrsA